MVVNLHSPYEMEEFLRTNQKVYLVIKESDWKKEFYATDLEMISKDQIGNKTKIKLKEIISLFNKKELRKVFNSTETLYFMRNK